MNSNLKINILYDFQEGPWGGCNQFFKILKNGFIERGLYAETPDDADVILFHSYHRLGEVIKLKKKYPQKFFMYRLGEVFYYHRGKNWKIIDHLLIKFAERLADKTIFVSYWLYNEYRNIGFKSKDYDIIHNAADPQIFCHKDHQLKPTEKIKIIAASWSLNKNKGFDLYKFLDEHLDFDKYSFTFVGNSPIKFKNIETVGPLASKELSQKFQEADIYITATEKDAYSNIIEEALSTGLPIVAVKSGGNPEAISGGGGVLFEGESQVIEKIEEIVNKYPFYAGTANGEKAEKIIQEYIEIAQAFKDKGSRDKSLILELEYYLMFFLFNMRQKLNQSLSKIMALKRASYRYYKWTWHRNILNGLITKNSKKINGKILDIGSRSRRYDQVFSGTVTAIDIEPNEEKNVVYGDIQDLHYADEQFDSVICIEVLCFVPNIKKAISEIKRVLKPGGYAIISNPFMQHDHDDRHRMTKLYAEELFNEPGFSEVAVDIYGNAHIAMWDIARKKFSQNKPALQRKLVFYLILLPWLILIKLLKLDKVTDRYYTGIFITLKK